MQTDLVFKGVHAITGETHQMRITVNFEDPDAVNAIMAQTLVRLGNGGFLSEETGVLKLIPGSSMKYITAEQSLITVIEGNARIVPA